MRWRLGPAIGVVLVLVVANLVAGLAVLFAADAWGETVWYPLASFAALLASYGTTVGMVVLLARGNGLSFAGSVALDVRPGRGWVAAALVAVVVSRVAGLGALALMDLAGVKLALPQTDVLNAFGPGLVGKATAVILALALAPLAEEIAFRGVLLPALSDRFGATAGALVSSAAFAAFHVQPTVMVVVFFAGLAFALLAQRYRSLWPPLVAHVAFNALSLAALFAGLAGT